MHKSSYENSFQITVLDILNNNMNKLRGKLWRMELRGSSSLEPNFPLFPLTTKWMGWREIILDLKNTCYKDFISETNISLTLGHWLFLSHPNQTDNIDITQR